MSIKQQRKEYTHLEELSPENNPYDVFIKWYELAKKSSVEEPNAMALATSSITGLPSVRMVLMKGIDENGFVFLSNYQSRKGIELANNPNAAIVFYWEPLEKQVRAVGKVERISESESREHFANRPHGAQVSAWASKQSQVVESRAALVAEHQKVSANYKDKSIPLPPHWGGYRLKASEIEFWQGAPNRLHDRIFYSLKEDGTWSVSRLYP